MPEYEYLWRNKFLATHTTSFNQFLKTMQEAVKTLEAWKKEGIKLRSDGIGDDYAWFYTTDPKLAKKYGFEEPEPYEEEE